MVAFSFFYSDLESRVVVLLVQESNAAKAQTTPSMDVRGGNYRAMGWNQSCFPNRGKCRRCDSDGTTKVQSVGAGCRMNGDAYGTIVSVCGQCGLLLWRSCDEASSD